MVNALLLEHVLSGFCLTCVCLRLILLRLFCNCLLLLFLASCVFVVLSGCWLLRVLLDLGSCYLFCLFAFEF